MIRNVLMSAGALTAIVSYMVMCRGFVTSILSLVLCIGGPVMGFSICLCLLAVFGRKTAEESVRWALMAKAYKREADDLRDQVLILEEERMFGKEGKDEQ